MFVPIHRHIVSNNSQNSWLPVMVTIGIAIFGWFISLLLQRSNQRGQLKTQIKYDIYKQITKIHQDTQEPLYSLAVVYLPFIMMDSTLIGIGPSKNRLQALQEGWEVWNKDIKNLLDKYFIFIDRNLNFLFLVEDWAGPLKNLEKVKDLLTKEVKTNQEQIFKQISDWQIITTKGYDWTTWNRSELEEQATVVRELANNIQLYLHDYLVLVHNELMSEYFDFKRPTRRPNDSKYKVLTIDGFLTKDDIK